MIDLLPVGSSPTILAAIYEIAKGKQGPPLPCVGGIPAKKMLTFRT